jgi:hypothetical protein
MRNMRGGSLAYPKIAERTMGYRFPKDPATVAQLAALKGIMREFLRIDTIKRFPDVSIDLMGNLFGLGERQAKTVVKEARDLEGSADLYLVIRVLHGMLSREIAGTLGTPKSMDVRWLFRRVYDFDLDRYRGKWPLTTIYVPLPPDVPRDPNSPTIRITGIGGHKFDLYVHTAEDGSLWIRDPSHPSDYDVLRTLHAVFRVEYLEWIEENR